MAKCYPRDPGYELPREIAEQRVFELASDLPDEVLVFAQVHLLDQHHVPREIDLLVAWPGYGLAILEVKGGRVHAAEGEWFSRDSQGRVHEIKDPIRQASKAMWALRNYVSSRGEWGTPWPPIAIPVAVLPFTTVPEGFDTPDAYAEQFLDTAAMTSPRAFEDALRRAFESSRHESVGVGEQIATDVLIDLLETSLPAPHDRQALIAEHRAIVDLLTRQQYALLAAVRTNPRIVVTGGPGTGKTFLALEHARRETMFGLRVALVCYSRGLAENLRREVSKLPADEQPAYVGTYHYLCETWAGITPPAGADGSYYEGLPQALLTAAQNFPAEDRFDVIVVDEAQDIAESWWPSLLATLNDPDSGRATVFLDETQRVFSDRGGVPFPAFKVNLSENLRNTRQIAGALQSFSPFGTTARGPEGDPVRWAAATDDTACSVAEQMVDSLLGRGWKPGQIAVLTTFRRHPSHEALVAGGNTQRYWRSYLDGDNVFYTTALSFKGLERPAVVLAVNGFSGSGTEQEMMHVAMSRARSLLVVCGDLDTIRSVHGGADLAEMLGTHPWSS